MTSPFTTQPFSPFLTASKPSPLSFNDSGETLGFLRIFGPANFAAQPFSKSFHRLPDGLNVRLHFRQARQYLIFFFVGKG